MADLRSSKLCRLCQYLLQEFERSTENWETSRNLYFPQSIRWLHGAFNNTACAVCSEYPELSKAMKNDAVRLDTRNSGMMLTFGDSILPGCLPRSPRLSPIQIKVIPVNGALLTKSQDIYQDDVIELVRLWMSHCLQEHTQCKSNIRPPKYPNRLLEIRDNMAYLIDCRHSQPNGPYATLSYCWGQLPFRVLTDDNIEEFRAGMALDEFLPTFRDAMTVARQLDLRYVWIDCFCIIQSNEKDMDEELANMAEIYSNPMINLGAAFASSPFDGCFDGRTRDPPLGICIRAELNGVVRSYHFFKRQEAERIAVRDTTELTSNNAIFERAWCLQERLLCSRMLHLSKAKVYWECNEWPLLTEKLPYHSKACRLDLVSIVPFSILPRPWVSSVAKVNSGTYQDVWAAIVQYYTRTDLSWPDHDKFAAIGGVAKVMAELMEDEYVAGFFRKTIVSQLAWYSIMPERHMSRPNLLRAPSWSWASVDDAIAMETLEGRSELLSADLVSIECTLADPSNRYGKLLAASLTLRGWLLEIEWEGIYRGGIGHWADHTFDVLLDNHQAQKNLLLLLTHIYDRQWTIHAFWGSGLLLERIRTGIFRRVGVVRDMQIEDESFAAIMNRQEIVTIL